MVAAVATAHFQYLLPSKVLVAATDGRQVELTVAFGHPFVGKMMEMAKPERFGVFHEGKAVDLMNKLVPVRLKGCSAWKCKYDLTTPGEYVFFVRPKPYWEPSEEKFIQHVTKVFVDFMGVEGDWMKPLGLKAEIVPLCRPYGLLEGFVFTGRALFKGKPMKNARVEVEYYADGGMEAANEVLEAWVLQTDETGKFSLALPRAGWWSIAALTEDDVKLKRTGKEYPVEVGAVLWLHVDGKGAWKEKR